MLLLDFSGNLLEEPTQKFSILIDFRRWELHKQGDYTKCSQSLDSLDFEFPTLGDHTAPRAGPSSPSIDLYILPT